MNCSPRVWPAAGLVKASIEAKTRALVPLWVRMESFQHDSKSFPHSFTITNVIIAFSVTYVVAALAVTLL